MNQLKHLLLFIFSPLSLLAVSCSGENENMSSGVLDEKTKQKNKYIRTLSLPAKNYIEVDNDIYMYQSEPSEKEKSDGKMLGKIVQFKYLGQDKSGFHKIGHISAYSDKMLYINKCKNPCKVIYRENEKIPFNSETIIGSAFEDVINSRINVANGYSLLKIDQFDKSVNLRYTSEMPSDLRRQWYVEYDDGSDYSFLFSKDGKRIIYLSDSGKRIISEIDFLRVTISESYSSIFYDIIFDENKKHILIIFDKNDGTLTVDTTDGNRTRFFPRDYQ